MTCFQSSVMSSSILIPNKSGDTCTCTNVSMRVKCIQRYDVGGLFNVTMNRKRPISEMQNQHQCCSFCPVIPVILIEYSTVETLHKKRNNDQSRHQQQPRNNNNHSHLKPPPQQPLCLLHFYTTDVCRNITMTTTNSKSINNSDLQSTTATIIDPIGLQQQLPSQQDYLRKHSYKFNNKYKMRYKGSNHCQIGR